MNDDGRLAMDSVSDLPILPPLCRIHDDALDAVLSHCDLPSVAHMARSCKRLAAFAFDGDRIFWRSHLVCALRIPSRDESNVELVPGPSARALLKATLIAAAASNRSSRTRSNRACGGGARGHPEWMRRRDDNERTIDVETTGWNAHRIEYAVDDASPRYPPGHDLAVRHWEALASEPCTTVRRRNDGSNILDIVTSSVFYFEVRLVSSTRSSRRRTQRQQQRVGEADDGASQSEAACVAIGLSTDTFPLSRYQPGWLENSIGYHGDDGRIYFGSTFGDHAAFGPTYVRPNVVVGCGVHIPTGSVFFTHNGQLVGTALAIVCEDAPVYPTIGLDSNEFVVQVNFGTDKPFCFDVHKAEALYSSYPPPVRRSRRLMNDDAPNCATILDRCGLVCRYAAAEAFHPWNADAITRRILVQPLFFGGLLGSDEFDQEGAEDFGYNSHEDSSFSTADAGGDSDGNDTD